MDESFNNEFEKIEKERKENVKQLINQLLERRKSINEKLEEEIKKLEANEQNINDEINSSMKEDMANTNINNNITNTTNNSIKTNIPFSDIFIKEFILRPEYPEIEIQINFEKSNTSLNHQRNLKLKINKRLSQVSSDQNHLVLLICELKEYNNSFLFIEYFTQILLNQGKLQVSSHPNSYINYSYLFAHLINSSLLIYFRIILFTRFDTPANLKGMYSIYFGILKICNMMDEAWMFIVSILNVHPGEVSLHIVESFLRILGIEMKQAFPSFKGVLTYIKTKYLPLGDNQACAIRIIDIIDRII
ncbi:hypothetical protein TCON_0507 [Astathelohania contejeani]|uniref:Uncharacterized protein n=1 Tax=Astathelohania contejeani TaxID=164912 RepID=A0ABQ7I1M2_9MICR|nr:hypothetical protein TCON_0507 [Thelohania contejeani]